MTTRVQKRLQTETAHLQEEIHRRDLRLHEYIYVFCLSNRSESRIQQLQSQFSQSQAARESAVSQSRHLQSLIEEYFLRIVAIHRIDRSDPKRLCSSNCKT